MSISDARPSLDKDAYMAAAAAAPTGPPTPFARLYNHLRFAAAALGDDARAGLHAAIQRLMRDVYLAPKVVPGAHEHDQVFRLLRTYAELRRRLRTHTWREGPQYVEQRSPPMCAARTTLRTFTPMNYGACKKRTTTTKPYAPTYAFCWASTNYTHSVT